MNVKGLALCALATAALLSLAQAQAASSYDSMEDCGLPGATPGTCAAINAQQCWRLWGDLMQLRIQIRSYNLSREATENAAARLAYSPSGVAYRNSADVESIMREVADQLYDGRSPDSIRDQCIAYYHSPEVLNR